MCYRSWSFSASSGNCCGWGSGFRDLVCIYLCIVLHDDVQYRLKGFRGHIGYAYGCDWRSISMHRATAATACMDRCI